MRSFSCRQGVRRLPVGAIELQLNLTNFPGRLEDFDQFCWRTSFGCAV